MRRLTASTTEGREWSGDHNESTPATIGDVWCREQPSDVIFSVSRTGTIRPVRAAGRIDVESRVVKTAQCVGVGNEHRLL